MKFNHGAPYTRTSIGDLINDDRLKTSREGIISSGNSIFLFVTLDKTKQLNAKLQYNDFFENDLFHWDSQTTQTINTPRIQKIVKGEVEVLLFARVHEKTKSKTNPFIYCGRLSYKSHNPDTSKPVHIIFTCLDYEEESSAQLAKIYDWIPSCDQPRTANYETVTPKAKAVKKSASGGQVRVKCGFEELQNVETASRSNVRCKSLCGIAVSVIYVSLTTQWAIM